MALQEAKLMGLDLLPDPETFSNAPRDGTRAAYLYDNNVPEDWGSTASESEDDDHAAAGESDAAYMLETGGLTDREIDRLDGKTSNRLGKPVSSGVPAASAADKASGAASAAYPERETGANTGPKGVLADQKYHRQQQYQERMSSQQAHNARMIAKAPTTTTYREDAAREKKERELLEGLEDEEQDEDEKQILDRIRGKRMQDLTWAAKSAGAGAGSLSGRKMFGSLMEMNSAQYVSAIETEKKDVAVIIHIYSEFNPACKKLDGCLIRLAARYATTKFVRIKAMEVDFDEEVCPTVLVYRAGELIANLVMITYELSDDFDEAELEELFTKQKVLSPHDQYQREHSFFEQSLDSSSRAMASMSSQFEDFNMMSLGLGVGDGTTTGLGSGSRAGGRGILSGNVKEFRYQDYDDDDDEI
ncbi:hypothetical protein BGZ70_002121 [Mortierella alpina]|uniref:Phosducin domain-containing protein n=1 Tax=Mortierella alpina TaxID=64518 RepID=A0A9P6M5M8_MORAP|nr:hypothetical protein BGZ70_002121 [Mortierella alpina]